jgi:GNAT superfamily N-acetyltransferase
MKVRLAYETDEDVVVEMCRANVEETRPHLTFNEGRCRATFSSYLRFADPTVYVAEDKGEVVGLLVCNFYEHRGADGQFATQEVLYTRPDKRGTRAAALLMKQLIEWADVIGANEIIGGNDNEFNSERTARFLEHFGFKRVGYSMRREV